MTYTTYGTSRIYLRTEGQYHEPLVETCSTPEEAVELAALWNASSPNEQLAA